MSKSDKKAYFKAYYQTEQYKQANRLKAQRRRQARKDLTEYQAAINRQYYLTVTKPKRQQAQIARRNLYLSQETMAKQEQTIQGAGQQG